MYEKTIEFSRTFNIFEPGDIVEATSASPLYPGTYKVVVCREPLCYGDDVIVFVEGISRGVNGANLLLVE